MKVKGKEKITHETGSRIIDIFAGERPYWDLTFDPEMTVAFFDFCCKHSKFVSFDRKSDKPKNASQNLEGLKNKMESTLSRMIRKYHSNEDGYDEELKRTHSIENKDQFNAYIAKIRLDNQETLRTLGFEDSPANRHDIDAELGKLGMIERKKMILTGGPITMEWERCYFPTAAVKCYLDKVTDIFQFPIMIGEYEFEDWQFYRKDPDMDEEPFASATSHERDARLWLTISEYEEFKQIGLPPAILHKVYPPVTGKKAIQW